MSPAPRPFLSARALGLVAAALTFAGDQALKAGVRGWVPAPDRAPVELLPVFRLSWVENYGVSLGFLTAGSAAARWGLVAITAAIALGVVIWLLRETRRGETVPLGLVLGGALGNITDRIRLGYVEDFADLHFGEWRPFLVFNLADAAITIGVLLILARAYLSREKRPHDAAASHADAPPAAQAAPEN